MQNMRVGPMTSTTHESHGVESTHAREVRARNPSSSASRSPFIHGERCDCPECRIRYRQGRTLDQVDRNEAVMAWTLLIAGVLTLGTWLYLLFS